MLFRIGRPTALIPRSETRSHQGFSWEHDSVERTSREGFALRTTESDKELIVALQSC